MSVVPLLCFTHAAGWVNRRRDAGPLATGTAPKKRRPRESAGHGTATACLLGKLRTSVPCRVQVPR